MKQETSEKDKIKTETITTEKQSPAPLEDQTESPYEIYNNNIYVLVDDFIERNYNGISKQDLKSDRAFFPLLVKYIYDNYIGDLLKNKTVYRTHNIKPVYDINNLDILFDIYIDLVYKYKFNNRPLIVEYSLFTGINRDSIYDWKNGLNNNNISDSLSDKGATYSICDTVTKWIDVCERALIDGQDTIKDIFILKAKHGFRDTNNDIQITVNHKPVIDADNLPDLIGLK